MCYLCLLMFRCSAVARNCYRPASHWVGFRIFWSCRNVNHCSDDYDFDFVTTDWLWLVPEFIIQWRKTFKKAAQLNKASVPAWYLGTVFLASVLSDRQVWWFTWLCGYHSFDLLYTTILGIFILRRKCQMLKDRIELWYPFFTGAIILSPVQSVSLLYTKKTSTSGWGVVIMLIGIPVYYLTKAKE
jgi:hypothetical protein